MFTSPWVRVQPFVKLWTKLPAGATAPARRGTLYQIPHSQLANPYTPAQKGDVYVYDWGKGLGMSHLSIEVGWGSRAYQYGSQEGDYVDQHTTDRWRAPWNYGYLHPSGEINRAKMRVYYIRPTGRY